MKGVVVCDPDINHIPNGANEFDFIIIGSDGIFDKLNNENLNSIVWNTIKENQHINGITLHQICGKAADEILKHAAVQKTLDNISIVVIGFKKL